MNTKFILLLGFLMLSLISCTPEEDDNETLTNQVEILASDPPSEEAEEDIEPNE